jgi:fatty-acyl-CoA synthase
VTAPASVPHRIAVGGAEGAIDYEEFLGGAADAPVDTAVALDDICLLPHTSGTTGRPKRIMLTHANLTWNVVNFLSCAEFRSDDVTIAIAPFFRVGGLGVNVLPVLFMGGSVVVPAGGGPDEILELMERHRVTVGFGNPDSLEALVRSPRWPSADLSSVRFVVTGGAPVPERLLQGYGLSEAAPLALLLDPAHALDKVGSAGKPPLLVDVRIAGPDGANVEPGATGELLVRGPNVMPGYWNRPDASRAALSPDGWLRTGDAARSDDQGYLFIVDRVVDRIVTEGGDVYPGDVERVLAEHPDVSEAGVAQSPAGALIAFVKLVDRSTATSDELSAFAGERLAPNQTPNEVRFVDGLPRSSVGKLLRTELRTLASA